MSYFQEIAQRYSKALFQKAQTDVHREELLLDMRAFLELLEQISKLKTLFFSPVLNVEEKQQLLEKGFKNRIDSTLYLFLDLLICKGRLAFLSCIADRYEERVREKQGILEAQLESAVPVSSEDKERLLEKLEKSFGKKIVLQEKIDPTLEGGGMLMVGGYMIDSSIQNRLKRLKQALL